MQPDSVINPVLTARPTAFDFWETAQTLGFPAALWRLPNSQTKQLIVSFDEVLPRVSADLEELPGGFLLSPFDNLALIPTTDPTLPTEPPHPPARTLFLRADVHAVFSENGPENLTITPTEAADRFQRTLATNAGQKPASAAPLAEAIPTHSDEQARYEQGVGAAVEAMQRDEFRKVVLSRTKQVRFADVPNAVQLFDKLCRAYPAAFVSAVALPEREQIWISATPERLVSVGAGGIFRTAALAGTQSATDTAGTPKRPSEAMWSQKEIEEQALVSRYIIECFKKIRLREYQEEGPKTITAGNLMHLSTSFTVDTQAVCYPQLGTVMLRLLHPTSAVCGTPRDAAFHFIRQHEAHERELYGGYLGPVNLNADHESLNEPATHLFVHIRCMKVEGSRATLYAGAGITQDSVPEREWHETEMKCQTLLSVIGNS